MRFILRTGLAATLLCLPLQGCQRYLAFGTGTTVGLEIAQRPDQSPEMVFGFRRFEMASIPTPEYEDADDTSDAYSVLATFNVEYGNPFAPDPKSVTIHQLFITGRAACDAAKNPELQKVFGRTVRRINDKGRTAPARPSGQ